MVAHGRWVDAGVAQAGRSDCDGRGVRADGKQILQTRPSGSTRDRALVRRRHRSQPQPRTAAGSSADRCGSGADTDGQPPLRMPASGAPAARISGRRRSAPTPPTAGPAMAATPRPAGDARAPTSDLAALPCDAESEHGGVVSSFVSHLVSGVGDPDLVPVVAPVAPSTAWDRRDPAASTSSPSSRLGPNISGTADPAFAACTAGGFATACRAARPDITGRSD